MTRFDVSRADGGTGDAGFPPVFPEQVLSALAHNPQLSASESGQEWAGGGGMAQPQQTLYPKQSGSLGATRQAPFGQIPHYVQDMQQLPGHEIPQIGNGAPQQTQAMPSRQQWQELVGLPAKSGHSHEQFGLDTVPPPLSPVAPLRLRERIRLAVSVPVLVGVVVFMCAVLVAIALTILRGGGETAAAGQGVSTERAGQNWQLLGKQEGAAATHDVSVSGPGSTRIIVYVTGEVAKPGVVRLKQGARVVDAIEKAGGASAAAVLDGINLARVLQDGEQVSVPDAAAAAAETAAAGATSGGEGNPGAGSGKVNLNRADAAALDTLPGVGPALARRILDWRAANGIFTSIEQLREVSGIGDKVFAKLQEYVAVG